MTNKTKANNCLAFELAMNYTPSVENDLITIRQAADVRGHTTQAIRELIKKKRISAVKLKIGKAWVTHVSRTDVEQYAGLPAGRPKVGREAPEVAT